MVWHRSHSWNHWHASVGMVSVLACPHSGQVSVDSRIITVTLIYFINPYRVLFDGDDAMFRDTKVGQ
jgi:hypothetical protein